MSANNCTHLGWGWVYCFIDFLASMSKLIHTCFYNKSKVILCMTQIHLDLSVPLI